MSYKIQCFNVISYDITPKCLKYFIDRQNKANLEAVEKAIFLLCLDQPPPHSTQSPSVMEMPTSSVTARQCLHGDGTEDNSCNRWFDKIVQVLCTQFKMKIENTQGAKKINLPVTRMCTLCQPGSQALIKNFDFSSIGKNNSFSSSEEKVKLKIKNLILFPQQM